MVLHTVEFESQDELLNVCDFEAAWGALRSLGERFVVIFNGGKDAGASLNHKHMQVIPRSGHGGLEALVESSANGALRNARMLCWSGNGNADGDLVSATLDAVPFRLAVGALPDSPDGEALHELFVILRRELALEAHQAYNMVLYHHHMVVIPRRTANIDGIDANAAGMTGDVWCSSEDQFKEWQRVGPMKLLQEFGVPR
jgi:ATP adenylyltransferase